MLKTSILLHYRKAMLQTTTTTKTPTGYTSSDHNRKSRRDMKAESVEQHFRTSKYWALENHHSLHDRKCLPWDPSIVRPWLPRSDDTEANCRSVSAFIGKKRQASLKPGGRSVLKFPFKVGDLNSDWPRNRIK
jgi:hypothetical protein